MATLFVSHSSKDDSGANVLEAWLRANGFVDIFVDHHSIAGGDSWRRALQAAAGTCRVVLCLVTENWLASSECLAEFDASFYMGKRVFPLFLLPSTEVDLDLEAVKRLSRVRAHYQGLDLASCRRPGGLDLDANPDIAHRLKAGLREAGALSRVGLDPEAFAIDRKLRPSPFPGLASFGDDDADAARFYGRSREIAQTLEEIRAMRANGDRRPFVILGASGAGKSSLLKAGIIPRLRHEAPAWLPLRAFRPGNDPLLNFAEALARTLADFGKREAHGDIRDRLFAAWSKTERTGDGLTAAGRCALGAALEDEARRLRRAADCADATILISVDQAEELARAENESGAALADYLRAALAPATSAWRLAFTIRTDSFPELQSHRHFQGLEARCYDLRAMPVFRFDSVIEEPAQRYGVVVDHALVDALMEHAPKDDTLPLLAFALQRLWRQYATSGALTRDNYDKVGGLRGLIEHAAERALRGVTPEDDAPLPTSPPEQWRVDLAASTFVPALAQINDQGATIRRVAPWNSFSEEQQELLIRFHQWRLVVRKGETDGGFVEVAHEALFREWTRLTAWLEPERARLEALRSLQVDAQTWVRNNKDPAFLNHRGARFSDANTLVGVERYAKRLEAADVAYLAACGEAERAARRRRLRTQTLIGVLVFGVFAGLVARLNESYLQETWNWVTKMRPYMLAQVSPFVLKPEKERALQAAAGSRDSSGFRECARDCPEMIVIPPGVFWMGAPATDADQYPNESPRHWVEIAKPFAVSKFDVTVSEWNACVKVGGCPKTDDSDFFALQRRPENLEREPVINVSWSDAQKYVAWLSKMTGKSYRLLTEAEWEYAARAGATTRYPWGDLIGKGNANCNGCGSEWDNKASSPVGSFPPNAFGLYDMAGNVWQWVQDCVRGPGDGDYAEAPADGSAWTNGDCKRHYLRGGSFTRPPRNLRSTARLPNSKDDHSIYLGFRVARTLAP